MEEHKIQKIEKSEIIDVKNEVQVEQLNEKIELCLKHMGLPEKNIFASVNERKKVFYNFPLVVESINPQIKKNSYYLSKFFAAITVGLFDAALNYLWDAVVENLRNKVINFDISYFFDSNPNIRVKSHDSEELKKISDEDLVNGCRSIGVISDTVFQEITLIKYMRNHASAAHPNINEIKGLSLIGWLEVCNDGLFEKEFPTAAIVAKKFIVNIKENQSLNNENVAVAKKSLNDLKTEQIDSLLKALFGIFIDLQSPSNVRTNVFHFAETLWNKGSTQAKNQIGIQYAHFAANQEEEKTKLVRQFLEKVDGLGYLPESVKIVELDNWVQTLRNTHQASNNFYNEPSVAVQMKKYVNDNKSIPSQVRYEYVKILIECRMGNSYGVSNAAVPEYDFMIDQFGELEIFDFCKLLLDEDIICLLNKSYYHSNERITRFFEIAEKLKVRATGQMEEFLEFILSKQEPAKLHKFKAFQEMIDKLSK